MRSWSAGHETCHKRYMCSLAGSGNRETTVPLTRDKSMPLLADTGDTFFSFQHCSFIQVPTQCLSRDHRPWKTIRTLRQDTCLQLTGAPCG